MKITRKKIQHFENLIKEELKSVLSEDSLDYYSPKFMAPEKEATFLKDYKIALKKHNEAYKKYEEFIAKAHKTPGSDKFDDFVPKEFKIGSDLHRIGHRYVVKVKNKQPVKQGVWVDPSNTHAAAFLQLRTGKPKSGAKAAPVSFDAYFTVEALEHRRQKPGNVSTEKYMSQGGFKKGKDWDEYRASVSELLKVDSYHVYDIADRVLQAVPEDSPWAGLMPVLKKYWQEGEALEKLFKERTRQLSSAGINYTRDPDSLELIPGEGAGAAAGAAAGAVVGAAADQTPAAVTRDVAPAVPGAAIDLSGAEDDSEPGKINLDDAEDEDDDDGDETSNTPKTAKTADAGKDKNTPTPKPKAKPKAKVYAKDENTKFSLDDFNPPDQKVAETLGALVLALQHRLENLGLYKGGKEGVFGSGTARALRSSYFVHRTFNPREGEE